ncbi:putative deoxyribonuclease YcfH [compost metagenome]
MGFHLSFGGPITFKNAKQPKEVLKQTPIDRLLLETDAPYLTPHPYRGKRNESAYVNLVAEAAAELKGVSFQEIAEKTTRNALERFGIQ